jgi:hypothetical protein
MYGYMRMGKNFKDFKKKIGQADFLENRRVASPSSPLRWKKVSEKLANANFF